VSAGPIHPRPAVGLSLAAVGDDLLTLSAFAAVAVDALDRMVEDCAAPELAGQLHNLSRVLGHIEAGISLAGVSLMEHSGAAPPPELRSP
jgi:hypothetical protein